MSEVVHGSIVTGDGINALSNAHARNGKVFPVTYKFSNQDLQLDPTLHANDIVGWHTGTIDSYLPISEGVTQFTCIAEPHEATDYVRFVGLFLEDGTLFAVSKPPYPIPPTFRQIEDVQVKYSNVQELMDYKFIPTDVTEQNITAISNMVTLGNQVLKNTLKTEYIKLKGVK